jgi:flagellar L-ring protein FlgH
MKKQYWLHSKLIVIALWWAATSTHSAAQSLWKEDASVSMLSDKRARAVGDILTIVVQESNTASKDNTTKTAKSSDVDASVSSFLYSPGASGLLTKGGQLPAMKMSGTSDFTGGGQINNSEKIAAQIAVHVVDVLPNGNLVIEGTRRTSFAGETQDAVLHGVVRSEDVQSNNTVFSYNVADASIRYTSKGSVTDAQKKGWFTRVWDKVAPF